MKTDTPRPILLKDYRPPNYLIDTVSLDVSLHPTRTRIWARLKVRRNPAWPGNPGPLRLDGETIELESVRLDGRQLDPREYQLSSKELVIDALPEDPFTIETVAYCNPEANQALSGLYLSRGIYAEVTLFYKHQAWQAHEWTFADYRRADYQQFFSECRQYLQARRRAGRAS